MIEPGKELLHYRLAEKIGEGGMGVVWKAVDTSLDREVAIKILPQVFSQDHERLARFEREAKLLASLNHPNIAVVHGLHEAEGLRFLAMELVEGEDLSKRLERGPLGIDETLVVGRQVASALEAAHESGIMHRDLKPANIQLMPDGTAKVLDFGLAKAFEPDSASSDPSASPTVTSAGTVAGLLLGTAAYMSPEQARGQAVDKRTDIWAFGCVLFELLSARKAFPGSTVSDTIAGILRGEPDWAALPAALPRRARDLMQRCLEKEARERLRDIGDARIELTRATQKGATRDTVAQADARPATRAFGTPLLAAVLVGGALLGAALWHWLGPADQTVGPASNAVSRFTITIPDDLELQDVEISADGRVLAYIASVVSEGRASTPTERLYVRRLEQLEAQQIAEAHDLRWVRFSPDGRWLAYLATDATGDGTIRKVAVDGGPAVVLLDDVKPSRWYEAEWRKDDSLLFVTDGNLVRLPTRGGEPEDLLDVDAEGENSVVLSTHSLPDGNTILLGIGYLDEGGLAGRTELFTLDTRERRVLIRHGSGATYRSTGHIVFGEDNTILAVPFNLDSLELSGPEVPLISSQGQGALSDNGTLVFQSRVKRTNRLVLVDREGNIERLDGFDSALLEGGRPMRLRWSPDGSRIAAAIFDGKEARGRMWVYDLDRGTPVPLTFSGAFSNHPVWAPDGTQLAFAAVVEDRDWRVYRRPVDGSGSPEQFVESDESDLGDAPADWTRDGASLVFGRFKDNSGDIWIQPSDPGATPRPLIVTPADERSPRISPDGLWIAYQSDESGRNEIWVSPFSPADDAAVARKTRVSVDGGHRPKWSPDGRELFFLDASGRILGAEVKSATKRGLPAFGVPRVVLDRPALGLKYSYDVSPLDGRFVTTMREQGEGATNQIFVVLNWHTELIKRMR
jgi:Tol biopolymer transport system component